MGGRVGERERGLSKGEMASFSFFFLDGLAVW